MGAYLYIHPGCQKSHRFVLLVIETINDFEKERRLYFLG